MKCFTPDRQAAHKAADDYRIEANAAEARA
jgi:hypothetical protein